MNLSKIIQGLSLKEVIGDIDKDVVSVTFDSRKVEVGSLFVAQVGTQVDGHRFIPQALEKGAIAIVCENLPEELLPACTYLVAEHAGRTLGEIANRFLGEPSKQLQLVGVTGTNGKTTTATLLYQLFRKLGYKVGLLSTIENRINDRVLSTNLTTPDAVKLNECLSEMVEEGCAYAFMEVSSHAIDQGRSSGLHFAGGIFSNLSHDHLDYHGSFRAYLEAKKMFFDQLPKQAFALTNIDDKRGKVMVQNTKAEILTYSLRRLADYRVRIIENALTGLHLNLDGFDFYSHLIGEFNAYNLLSVYAAAVQLGQDKLEVLSALSELRAVPGRFEQVVVPQHRIIGIVDYSHTPDALEKVLETIHHLREGRGRVISVVGCGGDRDKAKRPKMATIAARLSDIAILTSDNPRTEDPMSIIQDMVEGLSEDLERKSMQQVDRKQAIRLASQLAQPDDIILVAGKGHENYQEIQGVKHPFDDKEILKEELVYKR
ncbi:MAG: UDP-N-acetylmuramoyl-L-alanyl-D-glutamate--2,6-diaminopimelate ligase [Saprospiraceae bacterium]|nr:UDP-N-acetylmuramoyl-L-alanyl-D-glutamate--2,6-diaminopimelate ligase [Saprospiraceae bacterium]